MKRGKRKSTYAKRPRDFDFMLFVKTLPCSVSEEWPAFPTAPTECGGVVETDHNSRDRGLGRKSDDSTCIALCTQHHRERSDHSGTFKHLTRDEIRAWFDRAQLRTRTAWDESRGIWVS